MASPVHIRHSRPQEPMWAVEHNDLPLEDSVAYSDATTATYENGSAANFFDHENSSAVNLFDDSCPEAVFNETRSAVDKEVFIYAACFLIVLCLASLIVNVVILCSVCFMRSRVERILLISLSLAAADTFSLFFYSLGLFLFTLLPRIGVLLEAPCMMLLIEALRMGAILTTMLHLAALATIHYLGILNPFRYNERMGTGMRRRNIHFCIAVLWTVPSSLLILDMFFLEGDGFKECPHDFITKARFRTRFSVPFFTTLGMMTFIYLHIYCMVVKNQKQCSGEKWSVGRRSMKKYNERKARGIEKATLTTMMILGSTIVGWMPAFIYFALFCRDCLLCRYWNQGTVEEFLVILVINFLLISKTATNCYIYAFRVREIKGALRRMKKWLLNCLCSSGEIRMRRAAGRSSGSLSWSSRPGTVRERTVIYRMDSTKESLSLVNGTSRRTFRRSSSLDRHNTSV